jgi:4-amino-4-deoxychorismate lyase
MDIEILINGKQQTKVSVFERALQFGDGVFETCRVLNGKILHWDLHFSRLTQGLKKLKIPLILEQDLLQDFDKIKRNDGVMKIIISRGQSFRGYKFNANLQPTRIVMMLEMPNIQPKYRLNICQSGYGHNTNLAGIKHNNRIEQILASASIEWDEGVMLDETGNVISATAANIFVVKNGRIKTPDLTHCGILGTRRALILRHNDICVTPISLPELLSADEVFLSSSILGIKPVIEIEEKLFNTHKITNEIIF